MKLKELFEAISQYYYVGDCVNSFDPDTSRCLINALPWLDATEFAQAEENDFTPVTRTRFNSVVMVPEGLTKSHRLQYFYDAKDDMYILYDEDKDIHYFFTK